MAWITPVTNRFPNSRTTAVDMNRITGNIKALGGSPVKLTYSNTDIVTLEEWEYICDFARAYNDNITRETTYINLNEIELTLEQLHEHSRLLPSNSLYPSNSIYPDMEV